MGQAALHAVFICIALVYIVPLLMTISVSFTDEKTLTAEGYSLIPVKFSTYAYELVFKNMGQMLRSYGVTILFTASATILAVVVMALLAYPLSRTNNCFRRALNFYVFFTMLFSGGMVPTYLLITNVLHINNTIFVYIFPGVVSAYYVMIIRTSYRAIPDELIEAAKVDGAKELFICFRIVMPLSKPTLASVGFLVLVAKWNDWMTSLLYIRDPALYSLQYLLQRLLQEANYLKSVASSEIGASSMAFPSETLRFAMAIVAAGPVLVIFPLFQKYFSKGMTVGGVKG